MLFDVTFQIFPEGVFGVPQEGTIVLPAGPREVVTGAFTNTGLVIGHGTLPVYRTREEALKLSLDLGSCTAFVEDNFITIRVDAEGPGEAYDRAVPPLESLIAHLAVDLRHAFLYRPIETRDAEGRPYLVPTSIGFQVTTYNLEQLASAFQSARDFGIIADPHLERAMHYFEHALYLISRRSDDPVPNSRHNRSLYSAIFLSLWKAVSTIVGDPSRDADYQKRYRAFGMDRAFFKDKIEWLRDLRNNSDVAHYTLGALSEQEVRDIYGKAVSIAAEVIQHYRTYLSKATPEA